MNYLFLFFTIVLALVAYNAITALGLYLWLTYPWFERKEIQPQATYRTPGDQ